MHLRLVHSSATLLSTPRASLNPGRCHGAQGLAVATPRALRHPDAVVERLAEWADEARQSGRTVRADNLLLLAWEAYDRPARTLN